jgi:hypothetical protein
VTITDKQAEAAEEARVRVLGGPLNGAYDGYFLTGFELGAQWARDLPWTDAQIDAAARSISTDESNPDWPGWDDLDDPEGFVRDAWREVARNALNAAQEAS